METEYLGNAYTTIKKNRIIIISTHDKNIVDLADVTINLDKGHIFEAEVL